MLKKISRISAAIALSLGLSALAAPVAIAAPETPTNLAPSITSEQVELLESDAPATVLMDANSGEILAVKEGIAPSIESRITELGPGCSTTSLCLHGKYKVGFQGAGTKYGSWGGIHGVMTQGTEAKVTLSNGVSTPRLAKQKKLLFDTPSTVTRVQIF
jgi:hypothetical protein